MVRLHRKRTSIPGCRWAARVLFFGGSSSLFLVLPLFVLVGSVGIVSCTSCVPPPSTSPCAESWANYSSGIAPGGSSVGGSEGLKPRTRFSGSPWSIPDRLQISVRGQPQLVHGRRVWPGRHGAPSLPQACPSRWASFFRHRCQRDGARRHETCCLLLRSVILFNTACRDRPGETVSSCPLPAAPGAPARGGHRRD